MDYRIREYDSNKNLMMEYGSHDTKLIDVVDYVQHLVLLDIKHNELRYYEILTDDNKIILSTMFERS